MSLKLILLTITMLSLMSGQSFGQRTDSTQAIGGIPSDSLYIIHENIPKSYIWGNSWYASTSYNLCKINEFYVILDEPMDPLRAEEAVVCSVCAPGAQVTACPSKTVSPSKWLKHSGNPVSFTFPHFRPEFGLTISTISLTRPIILDLLQDFHFFTSTFSIITPSMLAEPIIYSNMD